MANTIEQYAKLHAALVQEKKDLEGRLSDIDKALAGKLTPAKKKAAKKKKTTGKKRKKMIPGKFIVDYLIFTFRPHKKFNHR